MSEPLVFMRHARQIRKSDGTVICMNGIRAWCERYEIDVATFIRDGVPGERFAEIGDFYALAALDFARAEQGVQE